MNEIGIQFGEKMDSVKLAQEKRHPMQVKEIHIDEYYCPACGAENCCDQGVVGDKFCPNCGQALTVDMEY